jgi:internalin A
MADAAQPKRRWYQYSLRSLLIFVTLCAFACSWFAVKMRQARRQREAVAAIRIAGGKVIYDYEDPEASNVVPPGPLWLRNLLGDDFFANVDRVRLNGDTNAMHAALEHLKDLPRLRYLFLDLSSVTDDDLEYLKDLPQLLELDLNHTDVTDAGLEHLREMTNLQALSLFNWHVTDAGLKHLRGLNRVVALDLRKTRITDAGLEHIEGMAQLHYLDLAGTQVTDAAIEHLKGLIKLHELHLANTLVTDKGVKELQQALPNCRIER